MIKTEVLHKACIKLVQAMSIFHAIFARENPFHPAQVFLNETLCKLPNNFVFFFFFLLKLHSHTYRHFFDFITLL